MKGLRPNDLIFANSAGNRTGNKNWTRKVNWKRLTLVGGSMAFDTRPPRSGSLSE